MLIVRREAEQDIKEAYEWYEDARPNLGRNRTNLYGSLRDGGRFRRFTTMEVRQVVDLPQSETINQKKGKMVKQSQSSQLTVSSSLLAFPTCL